MTEKYYPKVDTLGQNCQWWTREGCLFPKAEMIGRVSCEGIIDDVCLYLLEGRKPKSLTEDQINKLKLNPPSLTHEFLIPPGDVKA